MNGYGVDLPPALLNIKWACQTSSKITFRNKSLSRTLV